MKNDYHKERERKRQEAINRHYDGGDFDGGDCEKWRHIVNEFVQGMKKEPKRFRQNINQN